MPCPSVTIVSETMVIPEKKSAMEDLKLSVSDLPMLSCHYIQKGLLFNRPSSLSIHSLLSLLSRSLSKALSLFPPLAGKLLTDHSSGDVFLASNDAGVLFLHADASSLSVGDILSPRHVPTDEIARLFAFDRTVSYAGHRIPIMAVQVTELSDGIFIGCSVNHAVVDGTSFWNFLNTFAECSRGFEKNNNVPDFSRDSVLISKSAVLRVPEGGPRVTFSVETPLKERIFSFSRESILKLKNKTNNHNPPKIAKSNEIEEILGKQTHDILFQNNKKPIVSSFQSLCGLLWRAVTRARKLPAEKTTTFRMAVNCRHRVSPKMKEFYFGNAIQSVATQAVAGELVSKDLKWCCEKLNESVKCHGDEKVRKMVKEWEKEPKCFPLGNPDGASITMGSSARFPMYENDFGWGRPLGVRSGRANKFDGKISAFPGREGGGTVDLEVVLSAQTMALLELDCEFMQYVSM